MRWLCIVICVAGCTTGGVDVWGGQAQRAQAGGYSFKVISTNDRAQAYRLTPQLRPKAPVVFAAARRAMEQASGCKVVQSTLSGDVALVEAELVC